MTLKYHLRVFPDWLPFHPHRWWIHTRTVYIPMSYLYGIRFKMEENDLILSLREVRYIIHYACTWHDTVPFLGTIHSKLLLNRLAGPTQ